MAKKHMPESKASHYKNPAHGVYAGEHGHIEMPPATPMKKGKKGKP